MDIVRKVDPRYNLVGLQRCVRKRNFKVIPMKQNKFNVLEMDIVRKVHQRYKGLQRCVMNRIFKMIPMMVTGDKKGCLADHINHVQGTSVSVLADGYRRLAEELNIPVCLTQVLIIITVTNAMTMTKGLLHTGIHDDYGNDCDDDNDYNGNDKDKNY